MWLIQIKAPARGASTIDGMVVTASRALAAHHRHCEGLFATARRVAADGDWATLRAAVGALREAILEHFRYEEERLFPLYEETSGEEGATEPFCAQHDDMRAAFWILATITPEDEPQRYRAELAALQAAFDAHAAEEERRMYPLFERMLER
jgi:DUF438 domain-containing protein